MPSTSHYVAATAVLASSASAFIAPAPMGLPARQGHGGGRAPPTAVGARKLSMVLVDKPGSGKNRMTETAFTEPLVEKKEFPGSLHGYQWVVKDSLPDKKLNMHEKTKKAKPGLQIMEELEDLAQQAKDKGGAQNLDEEDINVRLKWMGLFHRAKAAPGSFMWRFKCPNGSFSLKQWKVLNDQVREYYDGEKDHWKPTGCYSLTTRQNVQLFGIRLENLPRHWKALRDVGVYSLQSGMDNVRNAVGNPLAGIDPEELIDTRPYCEEFTNKLTNSGQGNPEFTNLPRKFNVCYVGSKEMFEHPHINDIAYVPAVDASGNKGWNIEVGGILSATRCEFAVPMGTHGTFVPLDKHWQVGEAIMTTFRDFGYRFNPRTKCRLMYLIDDMGIDGFRAEVERRYREATGEALAPEGKSLVPTEWKRREILGAHKQTDGKNWVGIHVPVGRAYPDEMDKLIALVDKYSDGDEIRITVETNLIVPHVSDANLQPLINDLEAQLPHWKLNPATISKGTVTCTGTQFCGQAKINTKGNADDFAERLDAKYDFPNDVRIHWTGCPNTCSQIQVGDIGLIGTTAKNAAGEATEAVDIYVGGGIGQTAALGELYKKGVCVDEGLFEELEAICIDKFGAFPKAPKSEVVPSTVGDKADGNLLETVKSWFGAK
jgi:ferredoxin-nitrite reductase